MCGSNSDLQPRSVHPANPAPLQRERELHSNKPNSAPRDATVAVGKREGGSSRRRTEKDAIYLKQSEPEDRQADRDADRQAGRQTAAGTHRHGAQSASRRLPANSSDMASASYHISNLLEKMTSSDKDFR